MAPVRAPRRLTKEARRAQLIELAMPVLAEQGFGEFSFDDIADRADVTRNLLYRYFPRGRPDITAAAVHQAGRELTTGWVTDPDLSLEERLAANMARIAEHAFAPSDAWRIHRKARAADQPEITQIVDDYLGKVVANVSLNNLGTPTPPPAARLAILGVIALGETIIDEARDTNVPRELIGRIILEALVAALQAAQSTPPEPRSRRAQVQP